MGLLINQGKQDVTQDNKFNPIEEKDVLAKITKVALSTVLTDTIEVTMQLLNGLHKNRFVIDRVSFNPTSQFSWKYRALRKAANVPYSDTEPTTIDIEELLLNRAIVLDLSVRKGKNKDGVEQDYQNITYKKAEIVSKPADGYTADTSKHIEETEDFIDESEWNDD